MAVSQHSAAALGMPGSLASSMRVAAGPRACAAAVSAAAAACDGCPALTRRSSLPSPSLQFFGHLPRAVGKASKSTQAAAQAAAAPVAAPVAVRRPLASEIMAAARAAAQEGLQTVHAARAPGRVAGPSFTSFAASAL